MTVRVTSVSPNHFVAYPADNQVYSYSYSCKSCGWTFISTDPQVKCPNDGSKHLVQDTQYSIDKKAEAAVQSDSSPLSEIAIELNT